MENENTNLPSNDILNKKSSNIDNLKNELFDDPRENDDNFNPNKLDINKARKRTFNPELSNLVTRIKSNEFDESINDESDNDDITEDKLLQKLHLLFYKSINLNGLDDIDSSFNPFVLFTENQNVDIEQIIFAELSKLSISNYALLSYSFDLKCYNIIINNINNIKNLSAENIIIDTAEELYNAIISSKTGLILNNQIINRNLYLKKRFTPGNKTLGNNFYFISFENIFSDFYSKTELLQKNKIFQTNLLPILMIHLNEDIDEHQKNLLYTKIGKQLAVYFLLFQREIFFRVRNTNFADLRNVFNYLDYAFQKLNRNSDCICCIIKIKFYVNIESSFVFKYMNIKLKSKLLENSVISRVEKDKLVIFIRKSNRKILDKIIEEFNKLYDIMLQVKFFTNEEIKNNVFL